MIIRKIEVRNFRKLEGPVVIDKLGAGLSIIEGDNEEGKSTLLQCVRCAFFEKHNVTGERASSFQPYNSSVRPEIRITFEIDSQRYTLFKAFCQRPEAELTTPTGRFTGNAAEEELEKLLRFTRAKRARRDDGDHDHEGIFGLFWVEQGKSFAPLDPNDDGRSSIVQALQKEVGDVLGGRRGQKILTEVGRRRNELLTSTGRARGEYADANKHVLELSNELAKLNQALADQERNTEELERYRNRLKRHEQDRSIECAQERVQNALEAQRAIEDLRRILQESQNAVATAEAKQELAVNKADQRSHAAEAVVAARLKVVQLEADWQQNQAVVQHLREQVKRDEDAAAQAATAFGNADRTYRKAEAAEDLARVHSELIRLERDEKAALAAKTAQESALVQANAIGIEKKHVTELNRLEEAVTRSQAQLDAVATNVCIKLDAGVKAEIDGIAIASDTERKITQTAVLQIAKCAKITITPGGDIGNPRTQLDRDAQKLRQVVAKLGVESAADAQAKLECRIELLNEAESNRQLVGAHAPDGLDKLRDRITAAEAEKKRLLEIAEGPPTSSQDAGGALVAARSARENAERELNATSRRVQQARTELATAVAQEAGCKANYGAEHAHLSDAEDRLAAARREVSDSDLQQAVLRAAQAVKTAITTADAAEATLNQAEPETVARELRISEQALNQVRGDIRDLQERVIRLETELRTTGASGLGERKQEFEGRLAVAQATAARLERQVKVIDLLYNALLESEREAKETFLRPVTNRVQPYLKLLLPGTELKLDEDMHIVGLRRGAVEEKFESLSVGTREQLAVLTRLAFADLLREHGQPAAVLLDDAIVYADDQRFDRMLHILHKAAERLQVIVLTCRERDYLAAGAPIIRLADCRVSAAAAGMVCS